MNESRWEHASFERMVRKGGTHTIVQAIWGDIFYKIKLKVENKIFSFET